MKKTKSILIQQWENETGEKWDVTQASAEFKNKTNVEDCIESFIKGNFIEDDEYDNLQDYRDFMRKNYFILESGIFFDLR